MASPQPSSLRDRLRSEVSDSILVAAERVVAASGIGGANMQALAKEAGVSVGTLYNYFGDRDGLLRALVVRHRRELSATIEAAAAATQGAGFEAQACAFVQATVELFDARRGFVRAALDSELWRALSRSPADGVHYQRVRHQLEARARQLVEVLLQERSLHGADAGRLAAYFSGAVRGLLLMRAQGENDLGATDEARRLVAWFVRGAGGAASRRRNGGTRESGATR
jgi:AcrR family transcriptional regulator